MTRKRYCDYCERQIEGDYYKVSLSTWVKGKIYGGYQKLTHHADMCGECDSKLRGGKSGTDRRMVRPK